MPPRTAIGDSRIDMVLHFKSVVGRLQSGDQILRQLKSEIMLQPECFGSMAPEVAGSDTLRCNMCGGTRTEAQFLAEMDRLR